MGLLGSMMANWQPVKVLAGIGGASGVGPPLHIAHSGN